ncbi:hypothetical protein MauCBS54593_004289 [Microsporum audouinii]
MSATTSTDTLETRVIYDILASIGEKQSIEIEILPEGLGPLLTDDSGRYIGVTKKALVRAFTIARRVFFDSRQSETVGSASSNACFCSSSSSAAAAAAAAAASTVILVFDSEHLTACNWRKRRILSSRLNGSNLTSSQTSQMHLLSIERNLTASLLGSPLHRHAKSPMLWYHRFWVMHQAHALQQASESKAEMLKGEIGLVLRAAENHPMNYYAFSYLRQYIALLTSSVEVDVLSEPNIPYEVKGEEAGTDRDQAETGVSTSQLISDTHLITTMCDWCLRHPGDNSGWMFLLHLLSLVEDDGDVLHDVVQRVISFGRAVRWQREALWTFVELAISKFETILSGLVDPAVHEGHGWAQDRAQERARPDGSVANKTAPGPRSWKRWTCHVVTYDGQP